MDVSRMPNFDGGTRIERPVFIDKLSMVSPHVSRRASQTPPSPIRKLAYLAAEARSRGTKVYHLNIGQPDITTPKEYWDGVAEYKSSVLAYEQSQGNERLMKAWSAYMNRTLKLATKPEDFLITTGASEALIFAFMVCSDPGDEILIFDPTYANYMGFAAIAGVTLVPVAGNFEDNFALPEVDAIVAKITSRTKAVLLCSPNNPTGRVYTREELSTLLDICRQRNLFFVVDETYREFVYDGMPPLSILHLAPRDRNVLVIDSLSKRFSLCGARIGSIITANEEVYAMILNLAQARLASPTLEQSASAFMLERISDTFINSVVQEYQKRRDVLIRSLLEISGVSVQKPSGAFYAIAKLPVEDAEDFARYLLSSFAVDGATTFVAPAAGFYMEGGRGESKIRVAYVLAVEDIKKAVGILGSGLLAYQNQVRV